MAMAEPDCQPSTFTDVKTPSVTAMDDPPVPGYEVADKPWKYIGYPYFAQFLASDDDFFVIRRFGTLNARLILLRQWEVTKLEEELRVLDERDRSQSRSNPNKHNGCFELYDDEYRKLMDKIEIALTKYHRLVLDHSQLKAHPIAPTRDVNNVTNWLNLNKSNSQTPCIHPDESAFITCEENRKAYNSNGPGDLINLVPNPKSPLRRQLERLSPFEWFKSFRREERMLPFNAASQPWYVYNTKQIMYHNDRRIDGVVNFLVCSVGVFMLLAPLWGLLYVEDPRLKLIISMHNLRQNLLTVLFRVTVFTVTFLGIMQTVTSDHSPNASVAITAAYTGVLVVFLQIGSYQLYLASLPAS